jgi:uncharacterized surface protein with fasciclin (FAS1) repeats
VRIAESGDTIEIDGEAAVVCGDVETANATVMTVDTGLTPPA